jgi:tRNA pseudouridine13 synthase
MITENFTDGLPYAYGSPLSSAAFKANCEDFCVKEELGYPLTEVGEHFYVKVQQKDANTHWTAKQLARFAGCPVSSVGYAGLKDRRAISIQWFSLYLPKVASLDFSQFSAPGLTVLSVCKHNKKLRRGAFASNHFEITLRESTLNWSDFTERLHKIKLHGVPNYFGPQRFGYQENNLKTLSQLVVNEDKPKIRDRHLKSLLLSSARSYLFNLVLAKRVKEGTWNQALKYEPLMLSGSQSFFIPAPEESSSDMIAHRLQVADIHTTGPLFGEGKHLEGEVALLENAITEENPKLCEWLLQNELKAQRRQLRLVPQHLDAFKIEPDLIKISLTLPSGQYATTLLRELINCNTTEMNDENPD